MGLSTRGRASCSGSATSPPRLWPTSSPWPPATSRATWARSSTTSTRLPTACSRTCPRATTRSAEVPLRLQDPDARAARRPQVRGGGPDCQQDHDPGPVRDPRPVHLGPGQGLSSRRRQHQQLPPAHLSLIIIDLQAEGGDEDEPTGDFMQRETKTIFMVYLRQLKMVQYRYIADMLLLLK